MSRSRSVMMKLPGCESSVRICLHEGQQSDIDAALRPCILYRPTASAQMKPPLFSHNGFLAAGSPLRHDGMLSCCYAAMPPSFALLDTGIRVREGR